jgi:3-methyl-2-oxobutanoate hydroxymethyltransferase
MSSSKKWTAMRIRAQKNQQKIATLTAYDFTTGHLVDEAGLPIVLVGDSLGMAVLGYDSTLPVTMDEMLHHTAAVARGVEKALVVADMPFLSYQVSTEQAIENAGRFLQAGADAVKIEGGAFRAPLIQTLIQNGIPVMGHIGLTPQSIQTLGGYRVQGRRPEEAERLLADARALDEAGIFSLVLECLPPELGKEITEAIETPTIGIGAGPHCDGQVLVVNDLLGLSGSFRPKFVKQYANLGPVIQEAFQAYRGEVEDGTFPSEEHSY